MKKRITDIISIDNSLAVPVYKQIVQSIHRSIERGVLSQNDMLPSVNSISETFSLARGSVFTAYNDLRASGIIDSVPGKGYFITSTRVNQKKRILLLLANFSPAEMSLYGNLFAALPGDCTLDVYFHHTKNELFETIITEQADRYNTFIIVPHIYPGAIDTLSKIDSKRLFLLDAGYKEYRKLFNGVYRNPEKIMNEVLTQFRENAARYKKIFLVPAGSPGTPDFTQAFTKVCKKLLLNARVLDNRDVTTIKKGEAFIVMEDRDLVAIIKSANDAGLKIGKDIGIISCAENMLKAVVNDGITTVETDTASVAKEILSMIFSGKEQVIESSVVITDRNSF